MDERLSRLQEMQAQIDVLEAKAKYLQGILDRLDVWTWDEWLRQCADDPKSPTGLKPELLGMLTAQDKKALAAIAACWQLHASADEDGAFASLQAIRQLLTGMQPKCHFFARELIAFAMDWPDRDRLWPLVTGPELLRLSLQEPAAPSLLEQVMDPDIISPATCMQCRAPLTNDGLICWCERCRSGGV